MNYEDFKQAFKAEMMDRIGVEGVEYYDQTIHKANRAKDALIIRPEGSEIGSVVFYEDRYRDYQDGRNIGSLADDAVSTLNYRRENIPEVPELSHAYLEENLYLTVMNAEMNREYLSEVPCEQLEDMAVVPRIRVNEESSMLVKEWMLEEYGFSKEELFETAHMNMEQQDYRCISLKTFVDNIMNITSGSGTHESVYVLTNEAMIDGASAILSKKAMAIAYHNIREDFFILPSSRHEVILIPRSIPMTVEQLTDMVVAANQSVVEAEDWLSDHVYRYNSNTGAIRMLEPKAEVPKMEKRAELSL